MLRRAGVLALLIFQALWLNVVVPGHTRGAVTLPGWDEAAKQPAAHACCAADSPAKHGRSSGPKHDSDRAAHCAVCFFAVRLSLPTTIDLTPAPLEFLCVRPKLPPQMIVTP